MNQFDPHHEDSLDGSKFEHSNNPSKLGMIHIPSPSAPKTASVNYRPKNLGKTQNHNLKNALNYGTYFDEVDHET